ncbi:MULTISPECIES: hypothetical protein [Mycolicibacterium]|uniref:Secreted protein n=2 Tax=Mycolicibacterium TaxID=1866885 RepID=A0A1A0P6A9_9MYCO|nr:MULTISPECIES: hypothetical protein [Mycolicibacterium]MCW1823643.1 hypothetical protein [Mycolicibacterium senegalense]OBB05182.1 hypothetical protein A5718_23245 [Mycolicibacterium conceptionense]OBF22281.1 hypothetical protein A5726_12620 [Mycolicibacterium conceptionense]OBF39865.1 hypothetical protein A5720_16390 [Mycolicibacterium conceptionense]OBI01400.1 hypothetical protein A5716_06430 [Mycolicibacterium conceptionense]
MDWRIRRTVTLAAAGGVVLGGVGAPPASATTMVPLSNHIRNCDFAEGLFLDGMGSGSGGGFAHIGGDGSQASAQVTMQSARPDTDYRVRLIQMPRSAVATCSAGDPGVSSGVLHTDASGSGTVTVSGPVVDGAGQAWVVVEGPPAPGRIRSDVYSSDFLASI